MPNGLRNRYTELCGLRGYRILSGGGHAVNGKVEEVRPFLHRSGFVFSRPLFSSIQGKRGRHNHRPGGPFMGHGNGLTCPQYAQLKDVATCGRFLMSWRGRRVIFY